MNFLDVLHNKKTPAEILRELGTLLKAERKNRKINQEELAQLISVSRDSISKIENGKENYNILTLLKVLKFFELTSLFEKLIEKRKTTNELAKLNKIMKNGS